MTERTDIERTGPSEGPGPEGGSRSPGRPRRWLGRAVKAGLIMLLAGVVLGGLGFAILSILFRSGNPALSNQVLAAINRAIGTDSTRFVCERIYGTPLRGAHLEQVRLLVRTPEGEVTWARARSIQVDYDAIALALGRPGDLRVTIDQPRLDLVHAKNGELVLPRFAARPKKRPSSQGTRLTIAIRDGAFTMDRADLRFGDIDGQATLSIASGRSTLDLQQLAGSSLTPGRPGRLELSGGFLIERGLFRADPLEIGLGASHVTAQVDWDLEKARVREGSLALNPFHVREFFKSMDIQSADGILHGEVTFAGTPTDGSARVCLEGTYAGETVDTLVLAATSRPRLVDVHDLRLRVRGAEITGGAAIDTRGWVDADLGFRNVNPALLPWFQSPKNTPAGALAGRARIHVRRAKPRPELDARVQLSPSRVGGLQIASGRLAVRTDRHGSATVDSAWLAVPGGVVAGNARLGADGALAARLTGRVDDLGRLDGLAGSIDPKGGTGRVTVQLSGTMESPHFQVQGDLFGAGLRNGVAGDTLTLEARGRIRPELDLTADLRVHGLRVGTRPLGNLDATVAGGRTLRIERYRQVLGDTVLTLNGVARFERGRVEGSLDSIALSVGPHHIRSRGTVHVASAGEHLRVSDLVLDLDPGTLEASIDWDPKRSIIDARGALANLDLSRLPEMRRGGRPAGEPVRDGGRFRGIARGEFLVSGPMADPDVSARLLVEGPEVGGVWGDSLEVALDYAPGVLTIDRASWRRGASGMRASGTIRPGTTLERWLRSISKGDRGWAAHAALAIDARVDSMDLGYLAPVDSSLRTLHGTAWVHARLSGTLEAPVVEVEGRAPGMSYRGVTGEVVGAGLAYADRRLRVARLEMRQKDAVSQIQGELPLDLSLYATDRVMDDAPMSLTVDMPGGDLSILPLLWPEIGRSSGRMNLTAKIEGTPRHPQVSGSVHVTDGVVRLAGREEVIRAIQLDATFDQERVTVTKVVGSQGSKGRLAAGGWWRLPPATPSPGEPPALGPRGEYRFEIKLTDFTATDRLNYAFRVSGDFQIQNARNPAGAQVPRITGRAAITKGEITIDLSKPASGPREPLPFLYFITVDPLRNVFYRTLDAEVQVENAGELIFKNEGYGDLALGILEVVGGKYYVLTREFRDLQGTVNFSSPDRIDPDVNVVGVAYLPDPNDQIDGRRTIYLPVTGRVSRLKVGPPYSDEIDASPNDLWKALAFGQFVHVGGSGLTPSGGGAEADMKVPISNYLFQNVERWIGSTGFIDTIDLRGSAGTTNTTGSSSAISVLGVGKYVTPEFYFKYSRDFSAQAEEQISADYRITRHILIKGQQINRPNNTNQNTASKEYNLDLKVRLEY